MPKQKHDLGLQKRKKALAAQALKQERKEAKPKPSFAIGQPASQYYLDNLYGPPQSERDRLHALKQFNQNQARPPKDKHLVPVSGPPRKKPGTKKPISKNAFHPKASRATAAPRPTPAVPEED